MLPDHPWFLFCCCTVEYVFLSLVCDSRGICLFCGPEKRLLLIFVEPLLGPLRLSPMRRLLLVLILIVSFLSIALIVCPWYSYDSYSPFFSFLFFAVFAVFRVLLDSPISYISLFFH